MIDDQLVDNCWQIISPSVFIAHQYSRTVLSWSFCLSATQCVY